MSKFQLRGPVAHVGNKTGTSRQGKAYSLPVMTVQIGEYEYTEVNVPDRLVGTFHPGQIVDLIVDVQAAGTFLNAQVVADVADRASALSL